MKENAELEKTKAQLELKNLKEELKNCGLYRAVDVKDKAVHDRKRVFHVPFNLRSKMSTTRYSIPGYPALYLGTSIALNCEEIHKYDHSFPLRYKAQKGNENRVPMVQH